MALSAAIARPATDTLRKQLDQYIKQAIEDWRVPGIAVCIVKGDSVVYSMTAGYADLAQRRPVTHETIFPVGSMGKSFTAFSLALLEHQGKLSLGNKVQQWLPWLDLKDPVMKQELTIADILSHRTGMETFAGDLLWTESVLSERELLTKWGHMQPAFPIRSRFGYCNLGYLAAGQIIEAATRQTWQQFTRQQILEPLGMQHSFVLKSDVQHYPDAASGYTLVNDTLLPIPAGTGVLQPFGGMYSTAEDMARWVMMHANDGLVHQQAVFPTGPVWEVRHPYTILGKAYIPGGRRILMNYGLGWELFNYNNSEVFCHGGAYSGFLSMMGFLPEQKAGFVVLTNSDSHELTEALRWRIIDLILGAPARDYSAELLAFSKDQQRQMQKGERLLADSALLNIPTSLPLAAFAGTYHSEIYGNISLQVAGNQLALTMEHHPSIKARLTHIGNNRFYCQYSHPMFGNTVWPFEVSNDSVNGATLYVHPFLEFTPYAFTKLPSRQTD
jgi:CubicO group peptidase (beta-lactamase class C family)